MPPSTATNSGNLPVPPPPQTPKTSPQGTPQGGDEVRCEWCAGKIIPQQGARTSSSVIKDKRSFATKIKTGLISIFKDNSPITTKEARKGPCKACGGKGTVKDPSKIAAPAAEKVKVNFQKNAEEITKLENTLAPHGGNRYTVIQGSEVLEVGLGFNDAPSYTVIEGAGKRNKRLIPHADLSSKGSPMFFEGADSNYVQGINSVASPGGHYFIKCANKFSVAAGAQGIDLTTGGPVTISGGITRISGPEITIGTQTGPLSLEGEVVHINGKSVEVATSDGDFCVRGNISSSGNVRVGGNTHSESISFVHAKCIGTKDTPTDESSPNDFHTGPAFYGSAGGTAQSEVALDMAAFMAANAAHSEKIKNIIGPAFQGALSDKVKNMAYQMTPYENEVTGWIIPGTEMRTERFDGQGGTITGTTGTAKGIFTPGVGMTANGYPVIGSALASTLTLTDITFNLTSVQIQLISQYVVENIKLHNFPHSHVLPDLKHSHNIRLPDIDCSSDTAEQLRGKVAGGENGAPLNFQTGKIKTFQENIDTILGAFKPPGQPKYSK